MKTLLLAYCLSTTAPWMQSECLNVSKVCNAVETKAEKKEMCVDTVIDCIMDGESVNFCSYEYNEYFLNGEL